jgi:hypothetical protein
MVKTYIHTNDHKPIASKPLSPPLTTASKFENNSLNQKNNYSMSGSSLKWKNNYSTSGFVSNNSPFNFLAKLTSLKDHPIPFSSVFHHHESKQHLDSKNVFPSLFLLSKSFTHPPTEDSSSSDCELENLLLHLAYGSSSPPLSPTSSNHTTNSSIFTERFLDFHRQPIHVFSSLSSFYYALKQPFSKSH